MIRIIVVPYLNGMVKIAMVIHHDEMVKNGTMVTYPDGGFPAETAVERLGSSLFLFSTI